MNTVRPPHFYPDPTMPITTPPAPTNGEALLHGTDLFGKPRDPHRHMAGLMREFTFPPFSVFNTRDGHWMARRRQWLRLGIKSEVGRGEHGDGAANGYDTAKARAFNMGLKASAKNGWAVADNKGSGVSIFDPVLCEIMYRWFCPPGGEVLDPFAGGSVRGIVSAVLGRHYTGIDLSERQVAANRVQATQILGDNFETTTHAFPRFPKWVAGDSARVKKLVHPEFTADFIFSCPPYANLEVYSDDSRDLSTMAYPDFLHNYQRIITRACGLLKPDRFAAFVVGEVRDQRAPGGPYLGLVPDTIAAFRAAGLEYYNHAILVNSAGSLPLRVRKQFHASRKLGNTHQTVLIFVKGCPKRATAANPLR